MFFRCIDLFIDTFAAGEELDDSLGFFGGSHIDKGDADGALTNMLHCNNVPVEGYECGVFHLLELGVFVSLGKFNSLYFSGLRLHGGTAPMCTDITRWVKHATRLVFVLYPPRHILHNYSITALASFDIRLRNAEQENQARIAEEKARRLTTLEAGFDTDDEEEPNNIDHVEGKPFTVKYPNMMKLPSSIKNKYVRRFLPSYHC